MMQFDEQKVLVPGMRCWGTIAFDKGNEYHFVIVHEDGATLPLADKQQWTGYTCSYRINQNPTIHFGDLSSTFAGAFHQCIDKLEELRT